MIDEQVAFDAAEHTHQYEDVPEFDLTAYSIEEIFAEKLRALFQRARARDYYDLYRMLTDASIDTSSIVPAFEAKCAHDDLDIDLRSGLPQRSRSEINAGWDSTLPTLVAELPDFEEVYERLDSFVKSLVTAVE